MSCIFGSALNVSIYSSPRSTQLQKFMMHNCNASDLSFWFKSSFVFVVEKIDMSMRGSVFFASSLLVSSFYSIYDANKFSRKFQTSYMKQIVLNASRLSFEEPKILKNFTDPPSNFVLAVCKFGPVVK